MSTLLDLFDLPPEKVRALAEAQSTPKPKPTDPLALLEARIAESKPQPLILGISTLVELCTCTSCNRTFERPSGTVQIHYHYPAHRFGSEAYTWETAPLPPNWRSLPRTVKTVSTTLPACHHCFESDTALWEPQQ